MGILPDGSSFFVDARFDRPSRRRAPRPSWEKFLFPCTLSFRIFEKRRCTHDMHPHAMVTGYLVRPPVLVFRYLPSMLKACCTACPDILYPDELRSYPERILLNLYGYWYGRGSLLWSSTSKYVQTFPESHFAVFKYWNSLVLRSRSRYVPAFLDCPFAASKIGKSLVLHSRSLHSSLVRLLVALLRVALDYYCNADLFVRPSSPRPKLHLLSRPARQPVLFRSR